ncbi:MAG: gephyrin-like molybdotransferase Glp [Spirochaetia bacterium]
MIELERALEIVRSVPPRVRVETIPLEDSPGRVLAREVVSPVDSPPFDKSAMDGFAICEGEDSAELRIVDTVAAGGLPATAVRKGECARIMTGAMLPPGAGRVIRRENVQERPGSIRIVAPEEGDNVIRRGASIRAGQPVLRPGVIGPTGVGVLAAAGIARVEVAVPPRAVILCTGPEIRPVGAALGPGEIFDSNGPQLCAQLAAMRCPGTARAGIEDKPAPLAAAMEEALSECELLLLTGGVSAGSFDFVPGCLEDLGAEILFHGVAVKPGKPTLFARRGEQYIFGLPGNPVSTFVIFELFVKPFLYRRMGIDWTPVTYRGRLARAFGRSAADRTEFLPVQVRHGVVETIGYHGSSHLNALAEAHGLMRIESGIHELEEGAQVDVRPL